MSVSTMPTTRVHQRDPVLSAAKERRMGVNARLREPELLEGIRIRRLDGARTWKFLD